MKASYDYDHFYTYGEITEIVKKHAKTHPQLVRLSSLATSKEGRETWLIEMTNTKAGGFSEKPAYFLNGHVHAGEVTGSMCAMYFMDYVLTNYETDLSIQELLDTTTFYIIPRSVPDGAEHYLTTPETLRSVNEMYPFEEIMPGVQPEDIDGDGAIRTMLVKSPYGVWKKAEDDPRILIKRRPDETQGVFYNVYSEGMIEDYDGVNINPAPAKFGLDLNRNFSVGWETGDKQPGAGNYPTDRQESRTLAEFVTAHKNICNAITFHTFTGIYLYPPGMKSKKLADPDDMKRYEYISEMAKEETGFAIMNIKDDFLGDFTSKTSGSFEDFLHFGRGIYAYTVETWDMPHQCGIELHFPDPFGLPDDKMTENAHKFYKWVDENDLGEHLKLWTVFEHPQLGEVELGGPDPKYIIQNPPPKFLPDQVERHTRFILRHARTMPHLRINTVKTQKLGSDIYRVDAYIYNSGYMPTYLLKESVSLGLAKDITVELKGEGITYLEGKQVQKIGHLEGFSGVKSGYFYFGMSAQQHDPVEKKISWVVKAANPCELTLTAISERAGSVVSTISL